MTALITMHNVKRFLENSAYVSHIFLFLFSSKCQKCSIEPSQEARAPATAEGNLKPDDSSPSAANTPRSTAAGRKQSRGSPISSQTLEVLSEFGTGAWGVVCVMTTGRAWQFRPYKWNEQRQLFHNGNVFFFCLFIGFSKRVLMICG